MGTRQMVRSFRERIRLRAEKIKLSSVHREWEAPVGYSGRGAR